MHVRNRLRPCFFDAKESESKRRRHARAPVGVNGMAEVLLRQRAVEAITGLSRSGIYKGMDEGRFPLPVTIENRSVAWVESEVSAWTAARIADRDQRQPRIGGALSS
jgi:prophage regulatory protein